jgi:hypothetical protein
MHEQQPVVCGRAGVCPFCLPVVVSSICVPFRQVRVPCPRVGGVGGPDVQRVEPKEVEGGKKIKSSRASASAISMSWSTHVNTANRPCFVFWREGGCGLVNSPTTTTHLAAKKIN